jgi:hypothetical protein
LLTNGPYGTRLGRVVEIGPSITNAYAIVQSNAANGNFTFGHEVTHLIGGRHQQCVIFDECAGTSNAMQCGCDNTPGFNHGFSYRTGFFPFRSEKITLMHQLREGFTRQRELSFPTQKGTPIANDNARMMRENACTVSSFRGDPMSINIYGPQYISIPTTETYCVSIFNCNNTQSVNWQVSNDGWTYYNGGSNSCTSQFINSNTFYLRVTVVCNDGQTRTSFRTVYSDINLKIIKEKDVEQQTKTKSSTEQFEVFPNPSISRSTIKISNVKDEPSKVVISNSSGFSKGVVFKYDSQNKIVYSELNTSDLDNGLYILSCTVENKVISSKILIQHE